MRNRRRSETISSGGCASAYCRSCATAASRLARWPLYSPATQERFQTSAQPSPPVSWRAPRSTQYVAPVGSASAAGGSSRSRQRSRQCSCAADRSCSGASRHVALKACGGTRTYSRGEAAASGGGCENDRAHSVLDNPAPPSPVHAGDGLVGQEARATVAAELLHESPARGAQTHRRSFKMTKMAKMMNMPRSNTRECSSLSGLSGLSGARGDERSAPRPDSVGCSIADSPGPVPGMRMSQPPSTKPVRVGPSNTLDHRRPHAARGPILDACRPPSCPRRRAR